MNIGVKFGDYHSFEQWGLKLKNVKIGMPTPKKILLEIPGGDGTLDLSKSLSGRIRYGTRDLEFEFDARNCNYYNWSDLISDICGKIHGERKRIILDADPCYYYDGIINVSSEKTNEISARVVVEAECEPYKFELNSSLEDWEWDTFSFENGIIREYKDISINGSLEFLIPGNKKDVIPSIIVQSDDGNGMTVTFQDMTYSLSDGENRILTIIIVEGDNVLYFEGNGTVSIDYSGGMI
ncbi:MAG: mtfA protein [Blautia sp.]